MLLLLSRLPNVLPQSVPDLEAISEHEPQNFWGGGGGMPPIPQRGLKIKKLYTIQYCAPLF